MKKDELKQKHLQLCRENLPKLKKVGDKSKQPPKVKLPKLKKLKKEASV